MQFMKIFSEIHLGLVTGSFRPKEYFKYFLKLLTMVIVSCSYIKSLGVVDFEELKIINNFQ